MLFDANLYIVGFVMCIGQAVLFVYLCPRVRAYILACTHLLFQHVVNHMLVCASACVQVFVSSNWNFVDFPRIRKCCIRNG